MSFSCDAVILFRTYSPAFYKYLCGPLRLRSGQARKSCPDTKRRVGIHDFPHFVRNKRKVWARRMPQLQAVRGPVRLGWNPSPILHDSHSQGGKMHRFCALFPAWARTRLEVEKGAETASGGVALNPGQIWQPGTRAGQGRFELCTGICLCLESGCRKC